MLALSLVASPIVAATAVAEDAERERSGGGNVRALRGVESRYVAALSDGDFLATSYADTKLPNGLDLRYRDALTTFDLKSDHGRGSIGRASEVAVPNSVIGTPDMLTVSPDGRYIYVAEMFGSRPAVPETVRSQLAVGNRVTSLDMADPSNPRVVDEVTVAASPESIRISPDGRTLALATNQIDQEVIQLISVDSGNFATPQTFALTDLGILPREEVAKGGIDASFVDWHPNGDAIAVNLYTRNQVAFYKVTQSDESGNRSLAAWGEPVEVGRDPFGGRFTPDGKHYIAANWQRDMTATTLDGRLPTGSSQFASVRLDDGDNPTHRLVHSIDTNVSTEGIAISPDGTKLAALSMRNSAFLPDNPRYDPVSSLSLLSFDPATGIMQKQSEQYFEGLLPEGVTFDAAGTKLLASVFDYPGNDASPSSGLEVFDIDRQYRLQHQGRVELPPGTHGVVVAPVSR